MSLQLDMIDWLAGDTVPDAAGPAVLHRIDPSLNMARFYVLELTCDLFGQWCLERRWGRIGARRGQLRREVHPDKDAAQLAMNNMRVIKQRRGYH